MIAIINRIKAFENVSPDEVRPVRQYMRELKLKTGNNKDLTEACVKLEEKY